MSKPNGYRPMASGAARGELLAAAVGLRALTGKEPTQAEGKAAVSPAPGGGGRLERVGPASGPEGRPAAAGAAHIQGPSGSTAP